MKRSPGKQKTSHGVGALSLALLLGPIITIIIVVIITTTIITTTIINTTTISGTTAYYYSLFAGLEGRPDGVKLRIHPVAEAYIYIYIYIYMNNYIYIYIYIYADKRACGTSSVRPIFKLRIYKFGIRVKRILK